MNSLRMFSLSLLTCLILCSPLMATLPDLGPSFFSPQLSPDGTKFLWESLERGGSLWLSNTEGEKLEYVARGHSPSWLDDGTIKFVRSIDDGHKVLERALYRYSLADGVAVHLADSENPDYETVMVLNKNLLVGKGSLAGKVVVLDPGHGKNSGAYSKHTKRFEDYYVSQSANIVRDYLLRMGATVKMTRLDNTICPSLSSRVNFSNSMGASAFCSIHYNSAANEAAHGMEVFHRSWNTESKVLARHTHDRMKAETGIHSRGVKGDKEVLGFYLGVLSSNHKTNKKCLTEGAFLSNKEDAFAVNDPVYNTDLSYGIFAGLCETLGVEPLQKTSSAVELLVDDFTELTDSWVGMTQQSIAMETPTSDGMALLLTTEADESGVLRTGGMCWKDYEVSALMRSLDGPPATYGLIARCSDNNPNSTIGYVLSFDETTKTATLYASLGDVNEMVALKRMVLPEEELAQWNELSIRCANDEVMASVNGVALEALEMNSAALLSIQEQMQFGKVGLFLNGSKSGTKVVVDQFSVEPLTEPCP